MRPAIAIVDSSCNVVPSVIDKLLPPVAYHLHREITIWHVSFNFSLEVQIPTKMLCLAVRTNKNLHHHSCAQKKIHLPQASLMRFLGRGYIKHKHSRRALGGSTGAGETLCASKCFTKKKVNLLWLLFLCKSAILESIMSRQALGYDMSILALEMALGQHRLEARLLLSW